MILHTEVVDQAIDGALRQRFIKQTVAAQNSRHAIAMVRKRRADLSQPRGAVLLVHGFGQNRYAWHTSRRSFVNYLADGGWDVFNMDLRGRGRSRKYGAREDALIDDYIREDVPACARSVLRLTGFDRLFLVGHSMGGLINYGAAGSILRDEVAGLTSIGTPYRFGHGTWLLRTFGRLIYGASFTGAFDANPKLPLRFVGDQLQRFRALLNTSLPIPIRPWMPGSMENDLLEENLAVAFEPTKLSIALGLVTFGSHHGAISHDGLTDFGTAFELLDKPLLVIAGAEDALVPPESARPAYERSRASDRIYREFPMGHVDLVLGRHAPQLVWPLVRSWLDARAALSSFKQEARESRPSLRVESAPASDRSVGDG